MHARCVGRADLDPGCDRAREVANGERRLVGIGEPARRERDAFGVLETVGEHASDEVVLGLGRVARDAQREPLVDAAVGVREVDVERVDRRGKGQSGIPGAGQDSGWPRRSVMLRASTREIAVSPIRYHANTVSFPVRVISQVATAGAVPPNSAYARP